MHVLVSILLWNRQMELEKVANLNIKKTPTKYFYHFYYEYYCHFYRYYYYIVLTEN